jgi:hypothetical protein
MQENRLLALGIPTYKRPDVAVNVIRDALAMNIYDQIIVSSNSVEPELDAFVSKVEGGKLTFHQ